MTLIAEGLRVGEVRVERLVVEPGECVVLLGASGSGKTRLLRALADLDPAEGQIRLDGWDRYALSGHRWRQWVMYVPAESAWWGERVAEHFPEPPPPEAIERLALAPGVVDQPVARLSSGERQRLALLRAVVRRPQVLLLDEPTANLDAANIARVEAWLGAVRAEGGGQLWVTHDREQAARVATRTYRIDPAGRLERAA